MSDAEVVELDGQLRPLDPERREQLVLRLEVLHRGDRLLHPPEDDVTGIVALQHDRNDALTGLELISGSCSGPARTKAVPRTGCPANGSSEEGEDPDPRVPVRLRGVDEHGLRVVHLLREPLKLLLGISRASVNTASWLPCSGVSVKTSAIT